MKLKLDFDIPKPSSSMSIRQPVFMAGSCFATHLADRLLQQKFNILCNPNGILFNPVSIFKSLEDCLLNNSVDDTILLEHDGSWHSWEHNGRFSAVSKQALLDSITEARRMAHVHLVQSNWVVITLGSAWIYELKSTGAVVGNCHKVPQSTFNKRLLSVAEIKAAFNQLMKHPYMQNKNIMLSVSPVRYIKDGLIENNRSKAILLQAVHELCEQFQQAYYFPAYEIVIDELRDYRFYEKDMVHPNELAVDYVMEKFASTLFDDETKSILSKIDELLQAKQHRRLGANTIKHEQFLAIYLNKTEALAKAYPFLDLEEEINYFSKKTD